MLDPQEKIRFVESYVTDSLSPDTRSARRGDLANVVRTLRLDDFGQLLDLFPAGVQAFRDILVWRGRAASTICRCLSSLRELYSRAIECNVIRPPNPASSRLVKPPRPNDLPVSDYLTAGEVRRLIDACNVPLTRGRILTSIVSARDKAIVTVALYHGLRVSELAALTNARPDDWNRRRFGGYLGFAGDRDVLFIRGKGNKADVHPMRAETLQAVAGYLFQTRRNVRGDSGPLFLSLHGDHDGRGGRRKPLASRSIGRILRQRCRIAGIDFKRITPHSLRATAATQLLKLGVDVRSVQDFMRHASMNTTMRYLRLSGDLDEHAAARLVY